MNAHLAGVPETTPIEIWFQDEARIGQKNGVVRQWAKTGTRPRQPADQRYENAYLFGAICPAHGKGAVPSRRRLEVAEAISSFMKLSDHAARSMG